MDIDGSWADFVGGPGAVQELTPREHSPGIAREQQQQGVLARSQMDGRAAPSQFRQRGIDHVAVTHRHARPFLDRFRQTWTPDMDQPRNQLVAAHPEWERRVDACERRVAGGSGPPFGQHDGGHGRSATPLPSKQREVGRSPRRHGEDDKPRLVGGKRGTERSGARNEVSADIEAPEPPEQIGAGRIHQPVVRRLGRSCNAVHVVKRLTAVLTDGASAR